MEEIATQAFWLGLAKIIGVNVVLSGDNAVVIALAARSLPSKQQKQAILWGAGAAVVLRIILTVFAVALLTLPWLKIVGSLLLFWIGIKLLVPEEDDADITASDNLMVAIRTILIADLVMSLDNVIAVAAAAGGSLTLLILGLAISIPLVVFGATLLVTLMERYPVIITVGAGLIGMVAGEMLVTDTVVLDWMKDGVAGFQLEGGKPTLHGVELELAAGAIGAAIVVVWGLWLAKRQEAAAKTAEPAEKTEAGNS
jgi:YjbE family integral membrane protein